MEVDGVLESEYFARRTVNYLNGGREYGDRIKLVSRDTAFIFGINFTFRLNSDLVDILIDSSEFEGCDFRDHIYSIVSERTFRKKSLGKLEKSMKRYPYLKRKRIEFDENGDYHFRAEIEVDEAELTRAELSDKDWDNDVSSRMNKTFFSIYYHVLKPVLLYVVKKD